MAKMLPESRRAPQDDLLSLFAAVRGRSVALIEGLTAEDTAAQSMADASPAKWHLAHTSWFFDELVLRPAGLTGARAPDVYRILFNSYYEAVGDKYPRPNRGLLTRPSLADVLDYRAALDEAVSTELVRDRLPPEAMDMLELGLHHEQQHQELMLTDLLHLFAQNPCHPSYRRRPATASAGAGELRFISFDGGLRRAGHDGARFAFDCEKPRHAVYVAPFTLASRPVSNGEWLEFMSDGGYDSPTLWLSDGWATAQREGWRAPLYWEQSDGGWLRMTLHGLEPVRRHEPVCHISYFEADAFARWMDKRLPTEFEWEVAAEPLPVHGQFADSGPLTPEACRSDGLLQGLYGGVWEWTMSPYMPYPGFRPHRGAAAEYNGKFMCGQYVLRGGSCATPPGHLRATYRNFFYPHQRWQFSGLRLAEDRA